METPFDSLIAALWQSLLSGHHRKVQPNDLFSLVLNFSKIARVTYINMLEASEKMHLQVENQIKVPGTRSLTMKETIEHDDYHIRCTLSYMQFIEHLNRSGRVLKGHGFTPPLYYRVRFFRNKTVEHWDDYMHLRSVGHGDGLSFPKGKIAIPYAFAGISMSGVSYTLQQEITNEFAKYGVTLPSLSDKWYVEYSNIIYPALEQLDKDLRSYRNGVGIPEPLVTLLFKYSFPTPICNMEDYCKALVSWLETLPLN